ncbi:hypothetical protein BC629DRAFT_171864 [Irpex lacteus]|nr:hypothetical protein BC629DRAFT_171864 [Irpex lacteus]
MADDCSWGLYLEGIASTASDSDSASGWGTLTRCACRCVGCACRVDEWYQLGASSFKRHEGRNPELSVPFTGKGSREIGRAHNAVDGDAPFSSFWQSNSCREGLTLWLVQSPLRLPLCFFNISMSTFINEIHQDLPASIQLTPPSSSSSTLSYSQASEASTSAKDDLRPNFIDLHLSSSLYGLEYITDVVRDLQQRGVFARSPDAVLEALQPAIIGKVVSGFYLTAPEQFLEEAQQADSELEWWRDIERYRLSSAYFLL